MNENYDYKESLNNIKANLFDIYEDQERVVGTISDDLQRNKQVEDFIKVKDLALTLVNSISDLYDIKPLNNNYQQTIETPRIEEKDEDAEDSLTDKLLDEVGTNNKIEEKTTDNEVSQSEDVNGEEDIQSIDIEDKNQISDEEDDEEPLIKMKKIDNTNNDLEDNSDESDNESMELEKMYLDCDEKNLNFAYVPEPLFIKIRDHEDDEDTFNEEIEFGDEESDSSTQENELSSDDSEETEDEVLKKSFMDNSKLYRKDSNNVRGIIVRSDQYMKLALSKHRQEGVLEEAKAYRIEAVKRQRMKEQKEALENGQVHIDI